MKLSVPVRVDFAGGWLDVPQFALPGGKIVNCAVSPLISQDTNPYQHGGGVGGSAAFATLNGQDVRQHEAAAGADPSLGATHYFAVSIPAPAWAATGEFTTQVGNHRFYKNVP